MTIIKEERERLRGRYSAAIAGAEIVGILDALDAMERDRDTLRTRLTEEGRNVLRASLAFAQREAATERAAREKAEQRNSRLDDVLVGSLRARAEKAEAACAVMREALVDADRIDTAVRAALFATPQILNRQRGCWCRPVGSLWLSVEPGENLAGYSPVCRDEDQCVAVRNALALPVAVVRAAIADTAGQALLDEVGRYKAALTEIVDYVAVNEVAERMWPLAPGKMKAIARAALVPR